MRLQFPGASVGRWAAALVALAILIPATARAQTTPRNQRWDPDYRPPVTATGHPDLQGNRTNVTITPFQREEGQEPFYSWDEVDRREGRAEASIVNRARPSDPGRAPLFAATNPGGYNNVYIDRGTNIAVVNGEPRTSLLTNPPNGRVPDVTPIGQRRRAERARLGPASPRTTIRSSAAHDYRVIRLGEPDHRLPEQVTPWFGGSWGHWEGNTLLVETTNLNPNHPFRGMPPSPETKVHERFTRVDDDRMLYEFTVDDPAYAQPWGGEIPFESFDDLVFEYACHGAPTRS